ncbi:MAG: family 16 glycoside hydrolase [Verrucomicrobiota bacterium]
MNRRCFLQLGAASLGGLAFKSGEPPARAAAAPELPFKISLAEWSLNKTLRAGKMTNLDFPRVAKRDFNIDCIEFVDQFFADKPKDMNYLKELKQRAADEGVTMGLIMIDTNGPLGAAAVEKRDAAVEKTRPWIDAAKFLGCHTIRINAYGDGNAEELRGRIAESCSRLADYAAERNINVVIENHGKLSSDPAWLVSVMKAVGKPNFGTLPDFGNFPAEINRYDAVEMMMPYAKAVSAKSMAFTPEGLVEETDYFRMMRIVRDGGYTGHVGVESGAKQQEGEADAVRKTRDLLLRVREEQARCRPIFNGRDLDGWTKIEGGEWAIEDGVLLGRNGQKWSTNSELTGSWLSTEKQYGDFRLELQYLISERGNSGVFFRSSHEKNPAFTGYEFQIFDAPGRPPSKGGPSSLYEVIAPTKNVVRSGQWNTVTIVAKGPRIAVEVNGERVIDTEQSRSLRGYIGLQNHDAKSMVRFKNIRLEEL